MLNLMYYAIVRNMGAEARQEFDSAMAGVATATAKATPSTAPKPQVQKVNGKTPPPWWKGGEAAAQSSIQTAREMGMVVGRLQ